MGCLTRNGILGLSFDIERERGCRGGVANKPGTEQRRHLPAGLIARVTSVARQRGRLRVSLTPASIVQAVPQLFFAGQLPLAPAAHAPDGLDPTTPPTATAGRARAASSCASPSLLSFGAHLDAVSVREAFFGVWPPQMRMTVA